MKKKIWILNHYAGRMLFDRGGRHYCFAKYLVRDGYEPVIFCCNNKHNPGTENFYETDTLWEEHVAEEINTPFVFVKGRPYIGNGKDRVLNMIDFYHNVKKAALEYAAENGKPDVVYASSVHPLTLVAGIQLAKRFGVKCVCEVRDLWPESLISYGIAKKDSLAVKLLRALEKWTYTKADSIIFTMEGAYEYIIEQGWEKRIPRSKVHFINNGVDLETFQQNEQDFQIQDPDLENSQYFKVIYTGTIKKANRINLLVDAAQKIDNKKIQILIWGDGDELQSLKEKAEKEGIRNLVFKGRVKKEEVPYILSRGDALFLDYFDETIARFGIRSNKLFEYVAAGKPILMSHITEHNPASPFGCSLTYESSPEGIAWAIQKVAALERASYDVMSEKACEAAKAYSYSELSRSLEEIIVQ